MKEVDDMEYIQHHMNAGDPIPKGLNAKGKRKPEFLDRVQVSHFVKSEHIQIRLLDELGGSEISRYGLHNAKLFLGGWKDDKQIPNCIKVAIRTEALMPSAVYHVLGYSQLKEGEVHTYYRAYEGNGNYFLCRRSHEVAILSSGFNNKRIALLADVIYL